MCIVSFVNCWAEGDYRETFGLFVISEVLERFSFGFGFGRFERSSL